MVGNGLKLTHSGKDQSNEQFSDVARLVETFKDMIRDSGITDAEIEAIRAAHRKSRGALRLLVDTFDAEADPGPDGKDSPAKIRGQAWENEHTWPGNDSGEVGSAA